MELFPPERVMDGTTKKLDLESQGYNSQFIRVDEMVHRSYW